MRISSVSTRHLPRHHCRSHSSVRLTLEAVATRFEVVITAFAARPLLIGCCAALRRSAPRDDSAWLQATLLYISPALRLSSPHKTSRFVRADDAETICVGTSERPVMHQSRRSDSSSFLQIFELLVMRRIQFQAAVQFSVYARDKCIGAVRRPSSKRRQLSFAERFATLQ